jgi:hypothetical protein
LVRTGSSVQFTSAAPFKARKIGLFRTSLTDRQRRFPRNGARTSAKIGTFLTRGTRALFATIAAMTRDDVKAIIVDALERGATLGWWRKPDLQADLILQGLRAAGVKMRGPRNYNRERAADFMKRLLAKASGPHD